MAWISERLRSVPPLRPHVLCAVLLAVGSPTSAFGAQEEGSIFTADLLGSDSEDLYFGELPVVLSATRLTQPITEAPVALTVIDRQMIEASGARELADVLRLVPGFVVGSENGHQRIVGYHGLLDAFNRRMQVLVDGRSVYTPVYGGVRWTDLPLAIEDIERIEVVRGPNAATYGPNSFLGVISIQTRHATEDTGNIYKHSAGTKGISDAYYRNGGSVGDFDYRVSLRASSDSGFDAHHDDKVVKLLTFRGDYQATPNDNFEIHAGINEGPRELEQTLEREEKVESYFFQGLWRRTIAPGNEFRLQLYHNSDAIKDSYEAVAFPLFGTVNFDRTGERTNLELQHVLAVSPEIDLVWGGEIRRDTANSTTLFGTTDDVTNDLARIFGSVDWQLTEKTNLSLGLMVEENDITDRNTSPRVAINHQIAPGHILRTSYSKATRTPSLFEGRGRLGLIVNNALPPPAQVALVEYLAPATIEDEKIEAIDIGYFFTFPERNLTGDLRIFREKIHDLFSDINIAPGDIPATYNGVPVLVAGSSLDTGINADRVTIRGIDLQMDYRPNKNHRIYFGTSFLDTDSSNILENYQISVPDKTASIMWIYEHPSSWSTGLSLYYVDELSYLDTSDSDIVEEQRRVDFRIANKFKMSGNPAGVSIVFQNLLGSYTDYTQSNVFDTRAYVTFSIQF